MLIKEILNKKSSFSVIKDNDRQYFTEIKIGNKTFNFAAVKMGGRKWGIAFGDVQKNDIGLQRLSYVPTNDKNQLEVFSFVKDSIFAFIEKHDPGMITFEAKSDSGKLKTARADTYERLINRFKLPGYTVHRGIMPGDNEETFSITKD